jgi:hypothetical protein
MYNEPDNVRENLQGEPMTIKNLPPIFFFFSVFFYLANKKTCSWF